MVSKVSEFSGVMGKSSNGTTSGAITEAFQKRHYNEIADLLRRAEHKQEIVEGIIKMFKEDNPRFREDLFRKAIDPGSNWKKGELPKRPTKGGVKRMMDAPPADSPFESFEDQEHSELQALLEKRGNVDKRR